MELQYLNQVYTGVLHGVGWRKRGYCLSVNIARMSSALLSYLKYHFMPRMLFLFVLSLFLCVVSNELIIFITFYKYIVCKKGSVGHTNCAPPPPPPPPPPPHD